MSVKAQFVAILCLSACGQDDLAPIKRSSHAPPVSIGVDVPLDEPGEEDPTPPDDDPVDPAIPDPPDPTDPPDDPPDDPPEPNICELLEEMAGHCQNYGYECEAHTEQESWCFYDVLEAMPQPCVIF